MLLRQRIYAGSGGAYIFGDEFIVKELPIVGSCGFYDCQISENLLTAAAAKCYSLRYIITYIQIHLYARTTPTHYLTQDLTIRPSVIPSNSMLT